MTLGEDGMPQGIAERTVRRPFRVERSCAETGASGQCIRWSERELYREATLRGEVTFERTSRR